MPTVTLQFDNPLNVSCQAGDTAYYVTTGSDGGFTTNGANSIVEIGTIVEIADREVTPTLTVYSTLTGWSGGDLSGTQFILFSKNNKANLSSPLGYYAEVKMSTDASVIPSELHAVGMEMFASSK